MESPRNAMRHELGRVAGPPEPPSPDTSLPLTPAPLLAFAPPAPADDDAPALDCDEAAAPARAVAPLTLDCDEASAPARDDDAPAEAPGVLAARGICDAVSAGLAPASALEHAVLSATKPTRARGSSRCFANMLVMSKAVAESIGVGSARRARRRWLLAAPLAPNAARNAVIARARTLRLGARDTGQAYRRGLP